MIWYVGMYDGNEEDQYEKFWGDEDALSSMRYSDNGCELLELWECADDECLTPIRQVY